MGIGGVIAVAAQADGDERAYGVVRALHKVDRTHRSAIQLQDPFQEGFGVFHAAVVGGGNDGVRHGYPRLFQRLYRAPQRPFQQPSHPACFQRGNHLAEVRVLGPQLYYGADVYFLIHTHSKLRRSRFRQSQRHW